jgi:hypothetical protein
VPTVPVGPDSLEATRQANYCSGDATSSLDHKLEYRFDLCDGTTTDWSGSFCMSYAWTTSGSGCVKAQARCAAHTDKVSQWSQSLEVHVSPREVVLRHSLKRNTVGN